MTSAFKRTVQKFNGFWQVNMVEFLIDERKLLMMKIDYICTSGLICQQPVTQRNCLMLCQKESGFSLVRGMGGWETPNEL